MSSLSASAVPFIPNFSRTEEISCKLNKIKDDDNIVVKRNPIHKKGIPSSNVEKNRHKQRRKRRNKNTTEKKNVVDSSSAIYDHIDNADGLNTKPNDGFPKDSGQRKDFRQSKQKQKPSRDRKRLKNYQKDRKKEHDQDEIDFPPFNLLNLTKVTPPKLKIISSFKLTVKPDSWSTITSQTCQEAGGCHKPRERNITTTAAKSTIKIDDSSLTKLTTLSHKMSEINLERKINSDGTHEQINTEAQSHVTHEAKSNLNDVLLSSTTCQNQKNFNNQNKNGSTRLNMSKLRDRWWNILRHQATTNRNKSLSSISPSSDSSISSSSSSVSLYEATLVQTKPYSFACYGEEQNRFDRSPSQIETTLNPTKNHSSFQFHMRSDYPFHNAVCNSDISTIQYMLATPIEYQQYYEAFAPIRSLPIPKHYFDDLPFTNKPISLSPIQLAVYLDKPNILKLLLDSHVHFDTTGTDFDVTSTSSSPNTEKCTIPPLILAVQSAFDGCVKVLLSHGAKLTTKMKSTNDSIIHVCCRSAKSTTLQLLLNTVGKGSARTRIICSRNKKGQTPFHVACSNSRIDMVQELLSCCSVACAKAYSFEDNDGYTPLTAAVSVDALDVVALLLSWDCNHGMKRELKWKYTQPRHCSQDALDYLDHPNNDQHVLKSNFSSGSKVKNSPNNVASKANALGLAVSLGSTDMVRLLLEQNTSVSSDTSNLLELNHALASAIAFSDSVPIREEMLKLLIAAGANPYVSNSEYFQDESKFTSLNDAKLSPMCIAVSSGDISSLRIMLDSYDHQLTSSQKRRRSQPHLQKQPETYFLGKERKERLLVQTSLCNALVSSLYHEWADRQKENDRDSGHECLFSNKLRASLFLLKRGAVLDDPSFMRLVNSMSRYALGTKSYYPSASSKFKAHYLHLSPQPAKESLYGGVDNNTLSYWSSALSKLGWWITDIDMKDVQCNWMRDKLRNGNDVTSSDTEEGTCVLVIEGRRLVAHQSILSSKSPKLAAAIRFALLNHEQSSSPDCVGGVTDLNAVEIPLNLSLKMASLFIQHCYHGSIISGLSPDNKTCCRELLELSLLAEEFLCPSLSLEVEMRLISSKPRSCFCWCCCSHIERISFDQTQKPEHFSNDDFNVSNYFNCHYSVDSSSCLINADTAIDTLSLAQEIFVSCKDYSISVKSGDSFDDNQALSGYKDGRNRGEYIYDRPFIAVKAISLKALLQEFKNVLKSDGYIERYHDIMEDIQNEYVEIDKRCEEDFSLSILQTIVDELLSCSFPDNFVGGRTQYSRLAYTAQKR